jgi:hypothetical protein
MINVVVSDDPVRARQQARLPIAYYIGGMGDFYYASLSRLGLAEEADRVRKSWLAGRPGDAVRAVTDEMVERLAVCGPIARCRELLDRYVALGATLPIIGLLTDGNTAQKIKILESLAG